MKKYFKKKKKKIKKTQPQLTAMSVTARQAGSQRDAQLLVSN